MSGTNASIAVPSQKTKWDVLDPAEVTPTWVAIKGIKTFGRNEVAPNVNDETNLESDYIEKSIGLPDAGQLNLTMQYNRADPGQKILQDAKDDGSQITVRATLTDGSTETLECFVMTFPYSGSANGGGLEGPLVLEVTGQPGWTEPTP